MPPLANVPGVAQFKVFGLMNSQTILNIHHVNTASNVSAWSIGDLNLMSDTIWASYHTDLLPQLGTWFALGDVQAQDLTSVTGASGSHVGSAVGSAFGSPISQGSAACVNWLIGRHYRGGHPRSYIGGLTNNSILNSEVLDGTWTGHIDTWAANLMSGVAATALGRSGVPSLCCVHRVVNKTVLVSPLVDNYEGHIVQGRICSQRKRLV